MKILQSAQIHDQRLLSRCLLAQGGDAQFLYSAEKLISPFAKETEDDRLLLRGLSSNVKI